MIQNNLKNISNIVLLRSDKILYDLLTIDSYESLDKSLSYQNGMKDFYPNSFRKGAIENSIKETLSYSKAGSFTLNYEFDFLNNLFDAYLKFDGNHIYAKNELLDKYSSIINKIHPYNIIGYKLSQLYYEKKLSLSNIKEFTKYITPLALSVNRDYKEYAENHLHLGGSNDVLPNFISLLSSPTENKFYNIDYLSELPRINEFSYINNGNISFGNLIDISKYCVSIINGFVLGQKDRVNIKKDLDDLLKYGKVSMVDINLNSFSILEKLYTKKVNLKNELLKEVILCKKEGYTTKQWFLYNILIFNTHEVCNNQDIRRVIKIFLHIMNILRSYMVMSQNIGLSHFSEFFRSNFRYFEKKRYNNISSNIISNGTSKVEAKLSPAAITGKKKEFIYYKLSFDKEIIKKESTSISTSSEKYFLDTNKSKSNYHFCVHFTRKSDVVKLQNDIYCLPRFTKLRNELKKESKSLNNFLYRDSQIINKFDFYKEFYHDEIRVLEHKNNLENDYIDLTKLITTIDVAGDENRTPPEVFAPIIKYLRRDIKKLDTFKSNYIKYQKDGHDFVSNYKLRLSVHAGEDFNHIITGMRKIHETIKFYDMKDKDRLGHALAIGLNPKEWCELNGDIFVTKQEHLDNLVWLYHQSIEVLSYYKNTDKLREKYARVIKELYEEVYSPKKQNLSCEIDDIYKAWKLREFCPIVMFLEDELLNKADEYLNTVDFDNKKLLEDEYLKAKEIYRRYHTCSSVRKKGEEVIKIEYENINRNLFKYFITDEDLELIEAVQDRLIQKLCDKGLIIETNPSSNIYIAHIHSYDKHPIFRWNPIECDDLDGEEAKFNRYKIRSSRMKVCVNTDDPAIMPTTLRNEFDLLERTAFGIHSNSKEKIEKWSDDIRKFGVEIFDFDHQKSEFRRVDNFSSKKDESWKFKLLNNHENDKDKILKFNTWVEKLEELELEYDKCKNLLDEGLLERKKITENTSKLERNNSALKAINYFEEENNYTKSIYSNDKEKDRLVLEKNSLLEKELIENYDFKLSKSKNKVEIDLKNNQTFELEKSKKNNDNIFETLEETCTHFREEYLSNIGLLEKRLSNLKLVKIDLKRKLSYFGLNKGSLVVLNRYINKELKLNFNKKFKPYNIKKLKNELSNVITELKRIKKLLIISEQFGIILELNQNSKSILCNSLDIKIQEQKVLSKDLNKINEYINELNQQLEDKNFIPNTEKLLDLIKIFKSKNLCFISLEAISKQKKEISNDEEFFLKKEEEFSKTASDLKKEINNIENEIKKLDLEIESLKYKLNESNIKYQVELDNNKFKDITDIKLSLLSEQEKLELYNENRKIEEKYTNLEIVKNYVYSRLLEHKKKYINL